MLIVTLQWDSIIHYLNDFLVIQANMIKTHKYENDFDDLCAQLEFSVNLKKNLINITCIFLNIELDSIKLIVKLSFDINLLTRLKYSISTFWLDLILISSQYLIWVLNSTCQEIEYDVKRTKYRNFSDFSPLHYLFALFFW